MQRRPAVVFKAPEVFSLLDEPEKTIRFLKELQDFARRRDVFVELGAVRSVTPDAIAVLIAIVTRISEHPHVQIRGNYPGGQLAMDTIRDSGFDQYLRSSLPSASPRGAIVKRDVLRDAKKANPTLAQQLIDFAAAGGNRLRLKSAYSHLIECMGNTHEHAAPAIGSQRWWASVFQDKERECDCFTFVDMGVGIFNSIKLNKALQFLNWMHLSRTGVLRRLLLGNIQSRTELNYRGRGLPSIYRSCRNGRIRRLTVVTNDVHADVDNNRYTRLSSGLKGVVLYWEVPHERC